MAEGSLLVLFTDGLLARSGRDVDSSLTVLRELLGHGAGSPEEVCDRLLTALLPPDRPMTWPFSWRVPGRSTTATSPSWTFLPTLRPFPGRAVSPPPRAVP
ncbi:hypothetical protein ACFWWS_07470 [Streptomyces sp. NPDC059083]|uniref:hypothetical protein n=1 Tax=unclassified Streptomyces TaxID=2593676 RepID=UPI0036B675BD